jgi:hypothetical protein
MSDLWQPVAGSRFFTRNGAGLYERLTPHLYLRVDDLDEADAVECCRQLAGRWASESVSIGPREQARHHPRGTARGSDAAGGQPARTGAGGR